MPLCPACGDTVPEGAFSCPSCGEGMDRSVPCSRCGFPTKPWMKHCSSCGAALTSARTCRPEGFRVRGPLADARAALDGGLEAACAWPAKAGKHRTLSGKRTDPFYLVALLLSIASLVFTWVPDYNVSLAGFGLIFSLIGYQRFFSYRYRSRYRGLWINYIATAMGVCGLIAGIGVKAIF